MKKTRVLTILFSILVLSTTVQAQTEKSIVSAGEITWFGLDFSKAVFVGSFTQFAEAGEKGGDQIKSKYIPGWNDLIVNERQKYDLKKAYKKNSVVYDLDIVTKRNGAIDADKLLDLNASEDRLKKEDIAKVISQYKSDKKGVGLVYIVDTYSKADEKGVIWVAFFDIPTRKVLSVEKYSEKPGGIGLRNYWAKPVFEVMMKRSAEAYDKWAK